MDDFPLRLAVLLIALLLLVYLPIGTGWILHDRARTRGRHHDHLIPATPRRAHR